MITTTSISSVILTILKPFIFIYQFIYRIYWSGLNQRNIFQLIFNFLINFSPIFIWLLIFKNAGLIPHKLRPKIHVKLAYHLDHYIFETLIGGIINIFGLASLSWLLYRFIYKLKPHNNNSNRNHYQNEINLENYPPNNANDIYSLYKIPQNYEMNIAIDNDNNISSNSSNNSSDIELESFPKELLKPNYNQLPPINFQDQDLDPNSNSNSNLQLDTNNNNNTINEVNPMNNRFAPMVFIPQLTLIEIDQMTQSINNKILNHIHQSKNININNNNNNNNNNKLNLNYSPINSWDFCPSLLLSISWFLLNFVYYLHEPIKLWKDYLAWTSYVLCHITIPIITSIWLYIFHAPGSIKSYSFALGFQNICGVLTHLIFPNAPPWFIHMNGENAMANYDIPGYAAGLIRVDIALGTHLTSNGFHASPIVFGALPSLHSAMAVMTFFFIGYYSRWVIIKFLAFIYVIIQWWATIYLDHHWRLDLLIGLIYSIIWFTLIYKFFIKYQQKKFIMARLNYQFNNDGSTMGMRVFKNTKIQWFFDPFS